MVLFPTNKVVTLAINPPVPVPVAPVVREDALTTPEYVGKYDAILAFNPAVV